MNEIWKLFFYEFSFEQLNKIEHNENVLIKDFHILKSFSGF